MTLWTNTRLPLRTVSGSRRERGDVRNIENRPAVSMGPYLSESGQTRLLTPISIYSLRAESREVRLLTMNAAAIRVWEEMGNSPQIVGAQARPPRSAPVGVWRPLQPIARQKQRISPRQESPGVSGRNLLVPVHLSYFSSSSNSPHSRFRKTRV